MAITCSPTENTAILQCAQCWTPNQKLIALVAILCAINNTGTDDCDAETLLSSAACYTCASDSQLMDSILGILFQYAVDVTGLDEATVTAWLASSRACFECLDKQKLKAIIVSQLCTFYNNAAR